MRDRLNDPVLVLNRLWQPVHICTSRRAISLLCLGHAQVVHADESQNFATHDIDSWVATTRDLPEVDLIRSISTRFRQPEIIVLQLYDRLPKRDIKLTRANIFERDDFTCQYCARKFESRDLNLDHVVPREKRGPNTWENLVTSCIRCNNRKANRLPHEVNMFPLKEPRAPSWRPFHCIATRAAESQVSDSWRHFLDLNPRESAMVA